MIIATGRIATSPHLLSELFGDLKAGVERTENEPGCLFYSFGVEDQMQGTLLTVQIWSSEETLADHLCTPEIGSFVRKWSGRYEVETQVYDAANQRPVGQWHNAELAKMIADAQVGQ